MFSSTIKAQDVKSCPFYCKISKLCIDISQKCDDVVNCCSNEVNDQTDEAQCATILSPLPPMEVDMLESRMSQLSFYIVPDYATEDYKANWVVNGVDIIHDITYDIKLIDATPKYYSFSIMNPEMTLNNATLAFQVIEKKRTHESVCNKRPSIKGSFEMKLYVKKRPAKPIIAAFERKSIEIGRKEFFLSCTSSEGFVKPKLIWIRTINKTPKESESGLLTDVHDTKKIYSLILINNPQNYINYTIQCKTAFDFLNETQTDLSDTYTFGLPIIQYTSSEGEVIVPFGAPLNLTCSGIGFPTPLYKWAYSPSPFTSLANNLAPKKTEGASASLATNFLNIVWLTLSGKSTKPKYVAKEFIYIANITLQHSGFYQCLLSNEFGDTGSQLIHVTVPDPSLGFLSAYFVSKESFIGFVLGMIIFIILVGLVMYFVYIKVTRILEARNKLLLEQSAEAKRRVEEAKAMRHMKRDAALTAAVPSPGKRLKAPPPVSDVEQPFISAMDQANVAPTDDDILGGGGLTKFDESGFVPPSLAAMENVMPNNKPNSSFNFVTEFQYPDEDDDQLMNILKK